MARLRYNDVRATLDADIDDNDTTITFTGPLREWGEDNIATIGGGDILAVRIGWELLHITAYTSGASTATVLRGQEGSTATAHNEGDIARHVLTADDLDEFAGGGASVSDTAYDATSWNGVTTVAPSKNAVRDKIEDILDGVTFTGDVVVPDEAYDATSWNGSLEVPTKNALRDKIETLGSPTVSNDAYGSGWNGDTTTAPSKNAVYDKIETISAGAQELGSMLAGIDSRTAFEAEFGPDEGYDEEFDGANIADDTLPADWVDLSLEAAAVYRQAFGAGRIDWGGGGDGSNLQAIGRPIPATSTFDAWWHLKMASDASSNYVGGVILHNSANGRYVWFGMYQPGATNETALYVVYYSDADTSTTTLAGPIVVFPGKAYDGYFWIHKTSDGAAYYFLFSPDGACFFTVGNGIDVNASLGADPTHVGYALNTSGASHVACEWQRLRNVA